MYTVVRRKFNVLLSLSWTSQPRFVHLCLGIPVPLWYVMDDNVSFTAGLLTLLNLAWRSTTWAYEDVSVRHRF